MIAVLVNSLEDSVADATACMEPTGQCNFRSAMAISGPFLSTAGDECLVEFPAGETMYLDQDIVVEVGVGAGAGAITVEGNGCTVAPSPNASGPMRMRRIDTSSIILTSALTGPAAARVSTLELSRRIHFFNSARSFLASRTTFIRPYLEERELALSTEHEISV